MQNHATTRPTADAPTATHTAVSAFMYKSRGSLRTEPTASTLPQWQSTFWDRLERLVIDQVGNACVRVYALEKVLRVKRDQVSQESFLDEALAVSFFGAWVWVMPFSLVSRSPRPPPPLLPPFPFRPSPPLEFSFSSSSSSSSSCLASLGGGVLASRDLPRPERRK